jgi:hypothetical protein
LIDKIMGQLFNVADTYKGNFKGNTVINTESVTLKDMTIDGDLYLTVGIGDGNIILDRVLIKGKAIIHGGGKNGIIIRNSSIWGQVVVAKKGGNIRLVAEGSSTVNNVQLNSGAILVENNLTKISGYKGFGDIQINSGIPAKQEVRLNGDFGAVNIDASSLNIQVDGIVAKLQVREPGASNSIKLGSGNVTEFFVQGDRTIAELEGGAVSTFRVFETAEGSRVKVNGTSVSVIDIKANTSLDVLKGGVSSLNIDKTASGSYVNIVSSVRIPSITNTGNAVINGVTSGTYAPSIILNTQNFIIGKNIPTASKITVIPADAQLAFTSLNTAVASVHPTNGTVTGITSGTAVILVTASKAGYVSAAGTYIVTVDDAAANVTAAGSLAVSPANAMNAANASIDLTYTPGEALINGCVEFTMPSTGFTAGAGDQVVVLGGITINISGASTSFAGYSVAVSGRTVKVTGITCGINQTVALRLVNKIIPAVGTYSFSATADSDGSGSKAVSTASTAVFTSNATQAAPTTTWTRGQFYNYLLSYNNLSYNINK